MLTIVEENATVAGEQVGISRDLDSQSEIFDVHASPRFVIGVIFWWGNHSRRVSSEIDTNCGSRVAGAIQCETAESTLKYLLRAPTLPYHPPLTRSRIPQSAHV